MRGTRTGIAADSATTLRQVAYERFVDGLFNRVIQPGSFVSQRELSELLSVPVGPVREAIKRLEAEGLVTVFAQRGVQVRQIDYDLIRETFGLRVVLEVAALETFSANASDGEITDLITQTETVAAKLAGSDPTPELLAEVQRTDRLMHDRLIAAMDNSVITDTYNRNFQKIRLSRLNGRHLPGRSAEIMKEHLDVLHAARARNYDAARAALVRHLNTSHMRALGLGLPEGGIE